MPFPASSFQGDSCWESTGSAGAARNAQPNIRGWQPKGKWGLCPTQQGTEGPLGAAPAHLSCSASLWDSFLGTGMVLWELALSKVPPWGRRASLLWGIRAGQGCAVVVGAVLLCQCPLSPLPWGGCPQEELGDGCWDGGAHSQPWECSCPDQLHGLSPVPWGAEVPEGSFPPQLPAPLTDRGF